MSNVFIQSAIFKVNWQLHWQLFHSHTVTENACFVNNVVTGTAQVFHNISFSLDNAY